MRHSGKRSVRGRYRSMRKPTVSRWDDDSVMAVLLGPTCEGRPLGDSAHNSCWCRLSRLASVAFECFDVAGAARLGSSAWIRRSYANGLLKGAKRPLPAWLAAMR